ncbi:MAG: hypothetical protein NZ519_02885 [Bacteroidia bacterium]|nr:hypothetical protein [Bacteroidia bacterium]
MCFKLKQGKDITVQVNCVRGMEHAVRQYEAQRSTEAKRSAECPDPCAARGTPKKIKQLFKIYLIYFLRT